jgi:ectoine hydroxylase-related dioxygenase (phytanoyl-CoA dioxygenase family)
MRIPYFEVHDSAIVDPAYQDAAAVHTSTDHALGFESSAPQSTSLPFTTPQCHADLELPVLELQQFDRDGYVVVPNFCDLREVAWLRATLVTLFQERAGREQGNQFDMLGHDMEPTRARQPQILNPSLLVAALLHTAYARRVAAVAHQLLGPHARFSFDHSILKPAGSAAATPWHQDDAHQSSQRLRYPQISFWLALQDTAAENGCMRYVPGSQRGPLLPHRRLNDDPRVHAIECSSADFDVTAALTTPAAAGCCILHSSRTLHAALPNVSGADRIAYIMAFTGPPLPVERSRRMAIPAGHTANRRRRIRWLLRGGFVRVLTQRLRRVRAADPGALRLKLRALLASALTQKQAAPTADSSDTPQSAHSHQLNNS